MDEDYRVEPRSDDDTERLARDWRKALIGDAHRFDACAVLEKAGRDFQLTSKLKLVERPDAEMGRLDAYAQWVEGEPRVFAKKSVIALARNGHPRSISTLVHELMHIVLEHRRDDDDGARWRRNLTSFLLRFLVLLVCFVLGTLHSAEQVRDDDVRQFGNRHAYYQPGSSSTDHRL